MIVIDASVATDVLLRASGATVTANRLLAEESLHCPHLLDVEVAHAIRRHVALGHLEPELGRAALGDLADLPLRRYPHTKLLGRVWELRGAITAYDATYVALAEALDCVLLTRDRRLAAAPGHHARIELI